VTVTIAFSRSAAAVALLLFVLTTPAAAQGKGKALGKNKKQTQSAAAEAGGGAGAASIPGSGVRQFGVWLDDATVVPGGQGWAAFGVGYWRAPFGHQWDFPSVDAGIGVSSRLQLAISAPVSQVSYVDGSSDRSLGDAYLAAKVGIIDPEQKGRTFGLAVAPVIEVLGSGSIEEGADRVFWALPLTLEKRFEGFRMYGTLGYFSRGAAFGAAAVEVPLHEKVTATVTLSHSRSLEDDPLSEAQGLGPSRWDVSGGAVYSLSSKAALYASVGRTVSRLDANASSLGISAGVSMGFQHRIRGR
jgi:hypothetical protein